MTRPCNSFVVALTLTGFLVPIADCRQRNNLSPAKSSAGDADSPKVGFKFGDKFVECDATFSEFYSCCRRSKCSENAEKIERCCEESKRRQQQQSAEASAKVVDPDRLATCITGMTAYMEDRCADLNKDYCNYDSGLSNCCTKPPCNIRKMKEKYCC